MSVKCFEISHSNSAKFMTQENTIQVGWMWIFDVCYSQYAISVDFVCSTYYHLVVDRLHFIDLLTAKIKTVSSSGAACLQNWKVNLYISGEAQLQNQSELVTGVNSFRTILAIGIYHNNNVFCLWHMPRYIAI